MTNAVMSRLGVVNAAAPANWDDANALFLQEAMTDVLAAFDETNVFSALHQTRTIEKGKSASFPVMWKASARYHTAGTPIVGNNQIAHNEVVIKIDDKLISDVFIYDLDEAKNHYDVRSEYTKQLGASLAREYDQKVARMIVKAARASAIVSGGNGGSQITDASAKTDGEILAGMIFDAAQALDEKDVPEMDRYTVVKPAQYYLLAQTTKILNKDWGGAGSYSDGKVIKVADTTIVKSNNLPSTNVVSATTGENNDYTGDFTTTAAVTFNKYAAGTVKLMDVKLQLSGEDFRIMYQGDLMVGSYALGHGILRPDCAVELATA
jgi:hypothetical protein